LKTGGSKLTRRHQITMATGTQKDSGTLFYGHVVVAAATLILMVIWAVYYSFGVFFKPILSDFGWTRAMTSGAFSLSSITMGVTGIAIGWVNDRFGPRLVMSISGVLLGVGYILMSQISALWQIYFFYGMIVGAGMMGGFVPIMSTLARWFVKRRGMMTGIASAGIGVGAVIGPPLANRLISIYGWRLSYIILGCILLILVVLLSQILKRDPSVVGEVADGLDQVNQMDLSTGGEGLSFGEALYTAPFWLFFAMIFCFGSCVFSIMVHIAAHSTELGISPAGAAKILATLGGASIAGKLMLGRLSDIIGSRNIFIFGFLLMAVALFWLVPAKMTWELYCFAAIFGFAYGGGISAESPMVAFLFGLRSHGSILGVVGFGFTIGGAFGPWLTGHIFDMTHSYRAAFLGFAILSSIALFLTTVLRPKAFHETNHRPLPESVGFAAEE
jgi:MFS family permease